MTKEQLVKLNLCVKTNPQCIKVNVHLIKEKTEEFQTLLKEFKDVFSWIYKDLKGILPELAQHRIELDTSIPSTHQATYRLNPNYATTIKQDIDKLLVARFVQLVEEARWLSPIVVIPKKNRKLKKLCGFLKVKKATKKYVYPLPFLMKY